VRDIFGKGHANESTGGKDRRKLLNLKSGTASTRPISRITDDM